MSVLDPLVDRVLGPRVPPAEVPYPLPPGVTVRRNRLIPAVGGLFMRREGRPHRPAAAVTLGKTILVDAGAPLTDDLIVHELVHVEQWKSPLFPLKYLWESVRHGYWNNRYEVDAYARQKRYAEERPSAPQRTE
ncbi:MAG TPA: hypothetical protein VF746_12580 [Longimicrobium sp.]